MSKRTYAHFPVLPVLCSKPVVAPPFAVGSWLSLLSCPSAPPGQVQGMRHGRVVVRWGDLGYTGRHKPAALALVVEEEK